MIVNLKTFAVLSGLISSKYEATKLFYSRAKVERKVLNTNQDLN